jgi:outer membrane protein assembly factor BamB
MSSIHVNDASSIYMRELACRRWRRGIATGWFSLGRNCHQGVELARARIRPEDEETQVTMTRSARGAAFFGVVGAVVLIAACGGSGSPPHVADKPAAGVSKPPSAAPSPSTSAAPGNSPAAPGTVLATVQGQGRVNVISNLEGQGFTLVDSILGTNDADQSYLQPYSASGQALTEIPPGSISGECGAADIINSKGRLLLAEQIITHPAQGIRSASYSLTLTAYSVTTGQKLWTAALERNVQDEPSCTAYDGYLGSQNGADATFTMTANGQWGVWQPDDAHDLSGSIAVDLTTGKLYPKPDLYGALGNYVTFATMSSEFDSLTALTMTTPGAWPHLGTLTLDNTGDLYQIPGPYQLQLATSGAQFPNNDVTNPTAAAVTPAGNTLIGLQGNYDQGGPDATVAYALPSMKKLWSIPMPSGYFDTIEGISNSEVLLGRTQINGDNTMVLMALDPRTGRRIWQQSIGGGGQVCLLTTTQVVVLANSQLAFLDASTGQQASYESDTAIDDSGNDECPSVLAGGVSGLIYDGQSGAVTQLATP